MPEHRSTCRNGSANKPGLYLNVCASQLFIVLHAFVRSFAAIPDCAVVAVHGPADLHQRLMRQLMRQKECQVTPPGEGMLTATAQHHLGGNAGLSADRYDNVFDRYRRGDISQILVPGYKASTSFFLSRYTSVL